DQRRRLGRVTEASVDTVRDHRKLLARHSQLSRGLPRREFTTDDDPLDRAHHTPLDQRIEPVPIEVVVMGDDRDVQAVSAPGDQHRRTDVTKRVRTYEIVAGAIIETPDEGSDGERRDKPAPPWVHSRPMNRPLS